MVEEPMIFYSHYCYDCTCCFVSKKRINSRCWSCNSENTTSGVDEKYKTKDQSKSTGNVPGQGSNNDLRSNEDE